MPYDTSWITAATLSPPSTAPETQAHASPTHSPTRAGQASRRIWAVVPARKGSVGVPDKNIRPLGSSSLIARAIETADALGGDIVITTDYDTALFRYPKRALIVDRPAHLATRDASMWDVLSDLGHKLRWKCQDTIVLLQPTSLHEDRAGVIKTILKDHHRPCVTVDRYPDKWHPWYALSQSGERCAMPTNRHKLPPRFRPNGLAYIMSGCTARRGEFWQSAPRIYEVPGVLNIDSLSDWQEAVRLYG